MRHFIRGLLLSIVSFAFVAPALAATHHGSADDAVAMVKKGVAFLKTNGKDKFLSEVDDNKGPFASGEMYLSVWSTQAKVLAHGANTRLIGKDIINLKDADGKYFMKEIVEMAAKNSTGWVDYKWVNPVSKEIEAKRAYFERVDDMIISSGYYK